MVLRTAALYGRDPRELETSAEVLVLRGVHPTVDVAREALEKVRDVPLPEKPVRHRSVRTWVHSINMLLIFGGFLSAPSDERKESAHPWLKASLGFSFGAAIWVTTWVLPATFMVAMAWGCETHARQLGRRALLFYDGDADSAQAAIAAAKQREDRGHSKRQILRATLLALSVAIPIGFVAYADHVHRAPASTGSARSARSSRSPSSWPHPPSPTGAGRTPRRPRAERQERVSGATASRTAPKGSCGPALVSGDFTSYWGYVVGPVVGALIAVGFAVVLRGRGGSAIWRPGGSGVLEGSERQRARTQRRSTSV